LTTNTLVHALRADDGCQTLGSFSGLVTWTFSPVGSMKKSPFFKAYFLMDLSENFDYWQ
jgi:hypothetical protein